MESSAAAAGPVWSAAFWRRLSGPEEARALELLSYGLAGCMAVAAVLGRTIRVPYGRYSAALLGGSAPARLAWAVQEAPAFLLPLLLVLRSDGAQLPRWPNRVLLALFLAHYAYRCLRGMTSGVAASSSEIKSQLADAF
ncbi:UNVERIFIED_CONTAM: hypothetical protein K2H54_010582 [Gekko kuhli]